MDLMQQLQTGNGVRNQGKYIILNRDRDGNPTLMLGPHWYIFVVSFLVTLVLAALMLFSLKNAVSLIWQYTILLATLIYAYSYLRVGLSNPGLAEPLRNVDKSILQNPRFCQDCNTLRSHKVYHCYDCDVCIAGYDHHCPWVGKCIGEGNLCSFYFFLFMCFGTLILCMIVTISNSSSPYED